MLTYDVAVHVVLAARGLVFHLRPADLGGSCRGEHESSCKKSAANPPASWLSLKGCQFLSEDYSDGHSFHVRYGQRVFIFRLYFVDAPEIGLELKERIKEQAEYFGVTKEQVVQAEEAARKFTGAWLRQPFTVTTRWQNALGRSGLPRYYAFIESGGQDLATTLVSRGMARAKGTIAVPPVGRKAKDHMEKLKQIESAAQAARLGIWAQSTKRPVAAQKTPDSTNSVFIPVPVC